MRCPRVFSWAGMLLGMLVMLGGCGGGTADGPDAATSASADGNTAPRVVRVLPLGDSLTLGYGSGTEGEGSEAGYRGRLAELLTEEGVAFDFVGSQTNGPGAMSDRDHEGHNGFAISQVAELADAALDEHEPDVVLLMAGTNDQITFVPPSQPPADAAADLGRLLAQIHARRPGVQIVTAQVIPLTHNDEGIVEYNALLPAVVADAQTAGVNVRLVDMYAMGTDMLSSDGIHPTQAGYDRIAEIWLPALLDAIADL